MIETLPRKSRKYLTTSFYHIMVQGINKEYIFQKNEYKEKYLLNCIAYIHNNPVKAGMVEECKDYRYSNYIEFKAKNRCNAEYEICLKNNNFGKFIEIKEENIEEEIKYFIEKEKIELNKIKQNKIMLIKLIKHIKFRCNVADIEIAQKLGISKTTVWNYLNKN